MPLGGWTVCEENPDLNLWMAFKDGDEKDLEWVHFGPGRFKVRGVRKRFVLVVLLSVYQNLRHLYLHAILIFFPDQG